MKSKHFITHVNNIDLTLIAYNSVKNQENIKNNLYIIDNSEDREIEKNIDKFLDAKVLYGTQPLTTAQSMNWIREIAIKENLDVVSWQHNDAQPIEDTIEKSYQLANEYLTNNRKFGVIFTNYDTFCIFNVQALKEVGKWDWVNFPFYFLDNDYYYRIELLGYEIVKTNLPCIHHNECSNTIRVDENRKIQHTLTHQPLEEIIRIKHGVYKKYDK
jgi:hypothetical protein